jgi:hypothetical protein
MATVFDTLSFSRKLVDAGMERRQADALAGAVHDAVSGAVVTKPMLDTAVSDLRLEIQQVRAGQMTLQWMTGAIVAGVLALIAKSFF